MRLWPSISKARSFAAGAPKMAGFAKKFESAKQDWTTPDALFEPINAEFKFTLDAAADATNARADNFFCADDDGLRQDLVGPITVFRNRYASSSFVQNKRATTLCHQRCALTNDDRTTDRHG